ncbi:MAG: AMP-binding protein [Acidimicrobiia bacterium]|nr:AMP-binding protein [Acidimicrobiia bacterium]
MSVYAPYLRELTGPGGRFEVGEVSIRGVRQRGFVDQPNHLSFLIEVAQEHGDREFLVQGATRYTYAGAMERALFLAKGLVERFDLEGGDRVAILGSNAPDWVVSFWAITAMDGVAVPFNAWWTAEELAFGMADSQTRVVLCDVRRAGAAIEAGVAADRVVVWGDGEIPPGALRLAEVLSDQPHDREARRDTDEPAGLFYTSGTTGRPKASANSHRNIIANLMNAAAVFGAIGRHNKVFQQSDSTVTEPGDRSEERPQDIDLTVIPLFHTTALMSTMIPYVYAGHKLVFMPPGRFDPHEAARIIEAERVTRFGGVPTIVARIIDEHAYVDRDFSSVTSISYGGAPCAPALLRRIEQVFPSLKGRVIQGYGLTETSPLLTLNVGDDYHDHPNSVGVAVPTTELKIADPEGNALPVGTTGEIWAKGANVISGYWNRPDVNAEAFVDGYFRTGDIGYLDELGFLYITDRAKDVVIRGGENIYCVEVENVLIGHRAVVDVAVIGVPHEELGEEVKAVVVVEAQGAIDPGELETFARQHLASFKVPSQWEFRTDLLPRNASGKVLKPELRDGHSAVFAVGEESDSAL